MIYIKNSFLIPCIYIKLYPLVFFSFFFILNTTVAADKSDSLLVLLNSREISKESKAEIYAQIAHSYHYSNPDSAFYYGFKGLKLARTIGSYSGITLNCVELGNTYMTIDSLSLATQFYHIAVDKAMESENQSKLIDAWLKLGVAQQIGTKFAEALQTYNEGLSIAEKYGDTLAMARMYNNMAIVKSNVGEWRHSLYNYKQAGLLYNAHKDKKELGYVWHNMGLVYFNMGIDDSVMLYYNKSLAIFKDINDYYGLTNINLNLGNLLLKKDSLSLATQYYYSALESCIKLNQSEDKRLGAYTTAMVYLRLGSALSLENKYTLTAEYLYEAFQIASKLSNYDILSEASTNLANLYEKQGRTDSALIYYKHSLNFYDSLSQIKKDQEFSRLLYKYDLAKVEEKFAYEKKLSEERSQRKELNYILIIIIILSVLTLAITLFLLLRSRMKRISLIHKNVILLNKNLETELEFKKKELTTNVMYLMKKSEFIAEISRKLQSIEGKTQEDQEKSLSKIIGELDRNVSNAVWLDFETRFQEVHGDFYKKLSEKFPDLTPNDLKLCAFLKLNLSSKEISSLTFQTVDSLKVARHRLRKKLGLTREDNLVNFLNQI